MRRFVFFLIVLLSISSLFADEGMWLLQQLPSLELQKKGLNLQDEAIYHPDKPSIAKAIILLGGGTGSEVMKRIAAPMVGGMITAPLVSMVLLPVLYSLWQQRIAPAPIAAEAAPTGRGSPDRP